MKFKYNVRRNILESSEEDVYVRFKGFLPERLVWVLHYHGKKVGLYMWREKNDSPNSTTPSITNWLLSVGEYIPPATPSYKFESVQEQDEILAVIQEAFSSYDGVSEEPNASIKVQLHPILRNRIERGEMLVK